MIEILNVLSITLLVLGSLCNLVSGIGIFSFPDVYSRIHATGVTDTLGTGLILGGLMLQTSWDGAVGKLLLILIFTLITSPTISYVIANTAMTGKVEDDENQATGEEKETK